MANFENPIVYTITHDTDKYVLRTKDLRVEEYNRYVEVPENLEIFQMLTFITGTINRLGYAVLFEID